MLLRALVVLAIVLALPVTAQAHGMRTAYVEIEEVSPAHLAVRLRSTAQAAVEPSISGCTLTPLAGTSQDDTGVVHAFAGSCDAPLGDQQIAVSGLGGAITEAVVWLAPRGAPARSRLLTPEEPAWRLAPDAPEGVLAIAGQYVALGVKHIATGADHLLFLFLLILTVRGLRGALLAETAFSISHALSFTAVSLGWLRVSGAAAEACIALSLLLMALDVGRDDRPAPSSRHTALVALLFGAVHGLGFAGGLTEVGVPRDHAASALLGFGMGVEIGQVVFVLLAFGVVHLVRKSARHRPFALASAYAGGALATCWLLQRLLVLFPGVSSWRV